MEKPNTYTITCRTARTHRGEDVTWTPEISAGGVRYYAQERDTFDAADRDTERALDALDGERIRAEDEGRGAVVGQPRMALAAAMLSIVVLFLTIANLIVLGLAR